MGPNETKVRAIVQTHGWATLVKCGPGPLRRVVILVGGCDISTHKHPEREAAFAAVLDVLRAINPAIA